MVELISCQLVEEEIEEESYSTSLIESTSEIVIKTIVFDLGGVIFTDGSMLAIKKIKNALRLQDSDCELLEECFSNEPNSMGQLIRLGLITFDEFLDRFVKKLNLPKSKKTTIKHLWFSSYVPNYKMKKILKKLSKKYRIVAFSGNVKDRIKYLEKRYNFLKYFDYKVFSFDYHKNKRRMDFYEELLTHIDCDPSEAVLIDDSWNNIDRAEIVGLRGIHFSYTEQFLKDLKDYGIILDF